jgi:hypothetical protein
MAGLMNSGGGGGPNTMASTPMRSDGMAAAAPMEGGEESNVTPEEQAQYEAFVGNGLRLIFAEQTREQIAERIRASDPVEGLATTTVQIVTRLQQSAGQKGSEISPDVLFHGGMEIMSNIAELAEAADVHAYSEDEIESALYQALDQYGTQAMEAGTLDKEGIVSDFQALMQADQQGRLEEMLPGIEEKARQIGGAAGAQQSGRGER